MKKFGDSFNLRYFWSRNRKVYAMRRLVFGFFFACILFAAGAQKIDGYFAQMPDHLISQLEEAWRKDLIDLYKSGKPAVLENTMSGKSTLLKMTDHYLLLQSTERSTVELKLLPLINNTSILCMVETVYAPVADSRVSFYTTEWQPLPADEIFTPVSKNWFRKEDADTTQFEVLLQSEICLMKYHLSDQETTLTAEFTTPLNLDDESQQIVKPLLKDEPKTYQWKNGRFE